MAGTTQADAQGDGPTGAGSTSLTSPTIRNFRRDHQHQHRRRRAPHWTQTVSNAITKFSGSMTFVGLHVVWFGVWIVANLALPKPFDPFPFGLLTLVVSLEAIFLSTFVLISQNQQAAQSDGRELQDFQTNVYAEVLSELTAQKLGVDPKEVEAAYQRRMAEARTADQQTGTS